MSEFTKLSKRIDESARKLDTFRAAFMASDATARKWVGIDPSEADMVKLGLDIEECITGIETKFVAKINSVDPVSNTPRYGEGMKGKIIDAQKLALDTRGAFQEAKLAFDLAFERVRDLVVEKERIAQAQAAEASRISKGNSTVFTSSSFTASASVLEKSKIEEEEKIARSNQLLHDDAERAREAKRLRAAFKSALSELLPRLLYEQSLLWVHMELNVVFDMLMTKAALDRRQGIEVLKFVSKIMEQIMSKPDQIALRKLRLNHNTIWEKLTMHSHSLFLLIYCGFTMSLEPVKAEVFDFNDEVINYWYAIMESSGNPDIYSLFDISQLSNRQIIDLCTSVGFIPVMEMREPNVNSPDGMAEWIVWFDGIKAKRIEIESLIRS